MTVLASTRPFTAGSSKSSRPSAPATSGNPPAPAWPLSRKPSKARAEPSPSAPPQGRGRLSASPGPKNRTWRSNNLLKIALAQMRAEKGAIEENLTTISTLLTEATRRGVEIIGLPEMSLTGYADPNKYPQAVLGLEGP